MSDTSLIKRAHKPRAECAHLNPDPFAHIDALQTACAEFARAQGWIMSADVRAARANREMADLLDDVAVGNTEDLSGRLGNILFVLACLAEDYGFTLSAALSDVLSRNQNSDWITDSWGRGARRPKLGVEPSKINLEMVEICRSGAIKPAQLVLILVAGGATQIAAHKFVTAQLGSDAGLSNEMMNAADITPAARGAGVGPLHRFRLGGSKLRESVITVPNAPQIPGLPTVKKEPS